MSKFREMAWLDPLIAVLAALLLPDYTLVMKLLARKIPRFHRRGSRPK
jgi:hypothetical protein